MKLAEGKIYITRDGRTIGPVRRRQVLGVEGWFSQQFFDEVARYTSMGWNEDGSFIEGCTSALDLVRTSRRRPSTSEGGT